MNRLLLLAAMPGNAQCAVANYHQIALPVVATGLLVHVLCVGWPIALAARDVTTRWARVGTINKTVSRLAGG